MPRFNRGENFKRVVPSQARDESAVGLRGRRKSNTPAQIFGRKFVRVNLRVRLGSTLYHNVISETNDQ